MSDDNVIHAFPARGELPELPVEVERSRAYCNHPTIRLIEQDRQVVCLKCGAQLDPFNYLLAEAVALARGWQNYRELAARHRDLAEQVKKLEAERKRLTAANKRLQDKVDKTVSVRSKD